ncbi:glycosyltransferase family 2 protein [Roseivivax sp. CAU 1753]
MKIAALTMVYQDHWYLRQWLRHYDALIGRENCVVVSHGDAPEIREIAKGARIIPFPREDLANFDDARWLFLNDRQAELHDTHDCVITGDVDELVFGSDVDRPLASVLGQWRDRPCVFAMGFDLVEHPGMEAPYDDARPLWSQRRYGLWSSGYSKPAVTFQPVAYRPGAHRALDVPYYLAPGLHLAHIHYADSRQLKARRDTHTEVAAHWPDRARFTNHWKPGVERDIAIADADADIPGYEESYLAFYAMIREGFRGRGRGVGAPRTGGKLPFRLPATFARIAAPAAQEAATAMPKKKAASRPKTTRTTRTTKRKAS